MPLSRHVIECLRQKLGHYLYRVRYTEMHPQDKELIPVCVCKVRDILIMASSQMSSQINWQLVLCPVLYGEIVFVCVSVRVCM